MTTTTTAPETLAAPADLAAAWAKWSDPFDPTTDAEVTRMVALLMAAPLRTELVSPDGRLIIDTGGWSREQADALDDAYEPGTPEWIKALDATPYVRVTLTADGGPACVGAGRARWCTCDPFPDGADWVRYEHWEHDGGPVDRRHGFVCPDCRKITQSG